VSEIIYKRCDICGNPVTIGNYLRIAIFCPHYQEKEIPNMFQIFHLLGNEPQPIKKKPEHIVFDKHGETFDVCRDCIVKAGITITNDIISIDEFLYVVKAQLAKSIGDTNDLRKMLGETYKNIINSNSKSKE